MFTFTTTQKRQAGGAVLAAIVAAAASYGYDLSFLNEPWVMAILTGILTAGVSLFIPDHNKEPSLAEAYQKVQAAQQARDAERWAQSRDPARVYQPDENERAEP